MRYFTVLFAIFVFVASVMPASAQVTLEKSCYIRAQIVSAEKVGTQWETKLKIEETALLTPERRRTTYICFNERPDAAIVNFDKAYEIGKTVEFFYHRAQSTKDGTWREWGQ